MAKDRFIRTNQKRRIIKESKEGQENFLEIAKIARQVRREKATRTRDELRKNMIAAIAKKSGLLKDEIKQPIIRPIPWDMLTDKQKKQFNIQRIFSKASKVRQSDKAFVGDKFSDESLQTPRETVEKCST